MSKENQKERVSLFFEDLTYNTSYEFLEVGKNDDELADIADKRGIVLPSKDLAVFKGRYALVDVENKNKCTLPREEVKKALKTLNGKALDKDHFRKTAIGHWLQGELNEDEIISYGAMWKSNFPEDYKEIKKRMSEGKVKISFEAWGIRDLKEDGGYDLTDIHFAGGAFLFDTLPAFDEAEVMEFAKVMTEEDKAKLFSGAKEKFKCECIKCGAKVTSESHCKDLKCTKCGGQMRRESRPGPGQGTRLLNEAALVNLYNVEYLNTMLREIEKCPSCNSEYPAFSVLSVDFENNTMKVKHDSCGALIQIDYNPDVTVTKKGKNIKQVTALASKELEIKGDKQLKKHSKGGNKVMEQLLKKYSKETVEDVASFLDIEVEKIKAEASVKDTEIASLKEESEKIKVEAKASQDKLDARIAEEKAAEIKKRKEDLGEAAKDISDEDLLNDDKYKLAKANQEIAKLKKDNPNKGGLEAGQTTNTDNDPTFKKQKSIQEKAWQSDSEE